MTSVKMPQLGETVVEGTILKWLKQEGDQVALDEPLFEISTDKVDTEVPSSAAGTLSKILVGEGETVAVGTELAQIDGEGAAGGGPEKRSRAARAAGGTTGGTPRPSRRPPRRRPRPGPRPRRRPAPEPVPSQMAASQAEALPDRGPRSQILSAARPQAGDRARRRPLAGERHRHGRADHQEGRARLRRVARGRGARRSAAAAAAAAPAARRPARDGSGPRPATRRVSRAARRSFRSRTSAGRSRST